MTRQYKILIAASLVVNLLLLAVIAGHMWRHYAYGPYVFRPLRAVVKTLPADKQDAFESVLRTAEEDTQDARQQLRETREKAAGIMSAPSFDRTAYMAQIQRLQELQTQITLRLSDAVAAIATQCGPEDRARLAELVRHPPRPFKSKNAKP